MTKIQKRIEIVRTSIKKLSSMSIDSAISLQEALAHNYSEVKITDVTSLEDLVELKARNPDLVFLGMKQLVDHDKVIWLSDYLDGCDIPHTGSSHYAHALELDKSNAKARVINAGLNTSPYYVATKGGSITQDEMMFPYPLFVKPTDRGGGSGIDDQSVVHNLLELNTKVDAISARFDTYSLIEQYLDGREFSVAILRNLKSNDYLVMPLELIAPANMQGHRLLSSVVKSNDTEEFIEVYDQSIKTSVSELGLNVFKALGARDYGRIDIRLDSNGEPHFLEANLIPSILKDYGNFPKACFLNESISYEDLMLHITELAFERAHDSFDATESVLLSSSLATA